MPSRAKNTLLPAHRVLPICVSSLPALSPEPSLTQLASRVLSVSTSRRMGSPSLASKGLSWALALSKSAGMRARIFGKSCSTMGATNASSPSTNSKNSTITTVLAMLRERRPALLACNLPTKGLST